MEIIAWGVSHDRLSSPLPMIFSTVLSCAESKDPFLTPDMATEGDTNANRS